MPTRLRIEETKKKEKIERGDEKKVMMGKVGRDEERERKKERKKERDEGKERRKEEMMRK